MLRDFIIHETKKKKKAIDKLENFKNSNKKPEKWMKKWISDYWEDRAVFGIYTLIEEIKLSREAN